MKTINKFALSALTLTVLNVYGQDNNDQGMEEIVVTGQQYARIKALDVKRSSVSVMDALSTDNLGRLPDKNAAESLNRLPGVSVLIEKGEGQFASIRGIKPDWNNVTINGFTTGSPEKDGSGRQMPLDILGGELLETIEVYKARTPDMDGQGIGGSINIVTKKPLSQADFQGTVNLRMGIEEADQANPYYDKVSPYNVDFTLSGKLSDQLGWILGASKNHRQYLAQGVYQDDWAEVAGAEFPEQTKNNYYIVDRDRETYMFGLEYKATDDTSLMLQAFSSQFEEFQHRNRFRKGIEQDSAYISNITENGFDVQEEGVFIRADLRREDTEKELKNYSLIGQTTINDWTLDYGINYGQNEVYEESHSWDFRQTSGVNLGGGHVTILDNGISDLQATDSKLNNPENLRFNSYENPIEQAEQEITSIKFDARYSYMLSSFVGELKFGAKFTESDKTFNNTANSYQIEKLNIADFNIDDGAFQNNINGYQQDNVWLNLNGLNSLFNTSPELFFSDQESNTINSKAADKEVQEKTQAIYAMNTFDFDDWQFIVGARWEKTDVESRAFQRIDNGFKDANVSGSSAEVLPSLLANYHVTEDLLVRASWTKSLGRPNYGDISASSSYSVDEDGEGVLNIGNPDLKPYLSSNLDLSIEWYFKPSSILSLALFKKDVDNMIIADTQIIKGGVYDGVDYGIEKLNVVTLKNSDSASIEGYEFNVQYQFDTFIAPLNGLGTNYSFTSIDANFFDSETGEERKLEGQPETLHSLTVFYENYDFYIGFTYNYNAEFLTDINNIVDASDDVSQGEFGRWDFRASYNASNDLTVYLDVNNLNDEPTSEFQANNTQWSTEYEYVGRTYYLGLTYTF
ncbi:TonB-dependent receptor [Pseudoalteromonas haloplanktis]|uniref:TonB-dependent receptor n=1 Tax=Pseudoalteromonas haloplanktis TaxID=228 RepID=A0ABU1BFF3_PSEHA|nr:TonB-dependent receptor [Pseudoalteromonas haloplanktis]MDQ9092337.1 TonB-dependent receptor [Pseudoalteromonas haloplanktis]